MKVRKVMWAVYNSANDTMPRAIFPRKDDADRYHQGMHWGVTIRVEIESEPREKVIVLRMHEYRYIERKNP